MSQERKHILLEDILYYLSSPYDKVLRFYMLLSLKDKILLLFYDTNGHTGINKTFNAIMSKYYWLTLYKKIGKYVSKCVTCQKKGLKKQKVTLQEADNPQCPFSSRLGKTFPVLIS